MYNTVKWRLDTSMETSTGVYNCYVGTDGNIYANQKSNIIKREPPVWLSFIGIFFSPRVMSAALKFGLAACLMNRFERLGLAPNSQQIRLATKNLSNISRYEPNSASNLIKNATCGISITRVNLTCCLVQRIGVTVKFHTSPCRRAFPPVLLLLIKPLGKITAIVFEVDPITGRQKFIAYNNEQVMQMAQLELDAQIELHKGHFLFPSHPAFKRVAAVTNRLLKSNSDLPQVQSRKWLVTVVDDPDMKNAFVLPTGHIFIFTGMLNECLNDDQLCVILAHEISHVLLRHSAEMMSHLNFLEMMLMVPIALIWAILPDLAAIPTQWLSDHMTNLMFHLPFNRSLESEADRIGLQLTAKACYDVREASAFWAKMSVYEDDQVEWLSTHPNSEKRHEVLDELMPTAIKLRNDCKLRTHRSEARAVSE
ncbi:hypothetical protein C0J52_18769 [Blattella germanica]|nr:hypothetical protein C0J52_18769 [Blattella germanica]